MYRRMPFVLSLIAGLCVGFVHAQAATKVADPKSVMGLTNDLLYKNAWLLTPEQKAKVDTLFRDGREAEDRAHNAPNDEAKKKATAEQLKAVAAIIDLLDAHPKLIRLELSPDQLVLPVSGPHEFPGDEGALLIRTEFKGGSDAATVHAVYKSLDFSNIAQESRDGTVELPGDGVCYVLYNLNHVPKARTSMSLLFKSGARTWHMPVELRTAPRGRLKLTILDGETGKPTPAMARLTWKVMGNTYKIPNAIDIKDQFDQQGWVTSDRNYITPNPFHGNYWCVPGPVDMEVSAGEWEAMIRHGTEYLPIHEHFIVEPGQTIEKTYTLKRWVDMRKLGWYSGDDHAHCQILSDADADRLMTYAKAEDVHIVNVVKMGDIFRTWFEQRGWGPAYRVIDGDYVLSPGQECPRTHDQLGHTLAMNTKRMIRDTDKYYLYDWVFDQVHAEGGLSGYAHVNSGMFHVNRDMTINIPKGKIDFAEVLQFAQIDPSLWYRFLNSGFKVTASAGADIPWGGTLGEVRMYAYTGDQPFTADSWFEAVRRGHTFVTNVLMMDMKVDDAMPGDELVVKENRKVHVKVRAWGHPDWTVPAKLCIVCQGEEIKVVESSDKNQKELSIETDLDAGGGFWIAAHAVGTNGEHAHTTPIYVTRPGLRFWKYQDADKLVDQAMDSLGQIEKLVKDAQQQDAQHKLEDDRTLKQLAVQGPELMKRVNDARKIWQDLLKVAAKEAPIRAKLASTK